MKRSGGGGCGGQWRRRRQEAQVRVVPAHRTMYIMWTPIMQPIYSENGLSVCRELVLAYIKLFVTIVFVSPNFEEECPLNFTRIQIT